jgi:hypothetical protein
MKLTCFFDIKKYMLDKEKEGEGERDNRENCDTSQSISATLHNSVHRAQQTHQHIGNVDCCVAFTQKLPPTTFQQHNNNNNISNDSNNNNNNKSTYQ